MTGTTTALFLVTSRPILRSMDEREAWASRYAALGATWTAVDVSTDFVRAPEPNATDLMSVFDDDPSVAAWEEC